MISRLLLITTLAAPFLTPTSAQTLAQTPAPLTRIDPNAPANAGRLQLSNYLNAIAARDTATRRAAVAAINSKAEAQARQEKVRAKILSLIGPLPAKTPLNARVLGITQADNYRIEKILFDSQPGFHVTALLYLPASASATRKLPAILMAPGHGATGKAGDFAFASALARNGFAVLSYDPIGQGERLQYPDPARPGESLASRPTGEHGEAGLQPVLIGEAITKYFLWDAMRGIDYLLSRPEVDPNRIGAFGCSGGGTTTALVAALDPRVAVTGVACYTTSFDALLTSPTGPQDGEQSIPGFIAAGLDFPDWVELAAPRPYAVIATYSDMFPFAGARSTVIEARRFYSLFNPTTAGTTNKELSSFAAGGGPASVSSVPPTPTAPALNPDTTNTIPLSAPLQFITGPGGHGALGPITADIISFFLRNLQPGADPTHPILPPPRGSAPANLPKDALQVTPTGQVATSYPNSETIFSLNLKHASLILAQHPAPKSPPIAQLQQSIREVTHAEAIPGQYQSDPSVEGNTFAANDVTYHYLPVESEAGINFNVKLAVPDSPGEHPAVLLVAPELRLGGTTGPAADAVDTNLISLADAGDVVLAITPRPSPPGAEEIKSPVVGDFYLTSLRALLVDKSILGMRVDDVIRAVDLLAARPDVDPNDITATASGHMGLVLLHAALLDPRLKHITIDHTLASYDSLLKTPLPLDAPQDVVSGVLLHYDIPDLVRALGPRLTFTSPLQGTENLATKSLAAR